MPADPLSSEPLCKPTEKWLETSASFPSIFIRAIGSCAQKCPDGLQAAPHDGGSTPRFFKLSKFLQNYTSFLWKHASRWPHCSYISISYCHGVVMPQGWLCNSLGSSLHQFSSRNFQTAMQSFLMPSVFSWAPEVSRPMEGSAGCQSWHKVSWHGSWSQWQNWEEGTGSSSPFGISSNQIWSTHVVCLHTSIIMWGLL